MEQLRNIKDFVVGRTKVGHIKFLGITNVCGLDLDKIVTIEPKYVEVYPQEFFSENEKPPLGDVNGLNKPAIITLQEIYPKGRKTTDTNKIEKFIRKLQNVTDEWNVSVNQLISVFLTIDNRELLSIMIEKLVNGCLKLNIFKYNVVNKLVV